MMQSNQADITETLRKLLADVGSGDLSAVRAARLKKITKKRLKTFEAGLDALDALLVAIESRTEELEAQAVADTAVDPEPAALAAMALDEAAEAELPSVVVEDEVDSIPPEDGVAHDEAETIVTKDVVTAVSHADLAGAPSTAADSSTQALPVEDRPTPPAGTPAVRGEPLPLDGDVPSPGWTRGAELLFDDALRLFRLGDSEGALISLERLLSSTDLNDDLVEFVNVNQDRLLDLYQAIIGPWELVPRRVGVRADPLPESFFTTSKIEIVLDRVDGTASLDDIMSHGGMTPLESVAVLSQLFRAKVISTEQTTH